MIRRRKILDVLPRDRLLELAKEFGLSGLSAKTKDDIAAAIAAERSVKTPALLDGLARDELKSVCRAAGLDDSAREKRTIVARLLGQETGDNTNAPPADAPGDFQLSAEPAPAGRRKPRRSGLGLTNPADEPATSKRPASGKRDIEQYEHSGQHHRTEAPVFG